MTNARSNVDDAAAARFEIRKALLHEPNAGHVGAVHLLLKLLVSPLQERRVHFFCTVGVVHHDVHGAKGLDCRLDGLADVRLVSDVARSEDSTGTQRAQLGDDGRTGFGISAGDHYPRALLGHSEDDSASDTLPCTRNYGYFLIQPAHDGLLVEMELGRIFGIYFVY